MLYVGLLLFRGVIIFMEILTLANGVSPSTILPFEVGCGDVLMQLQVIIELWVLGYHGCPPAGLLMHHFVFYKLCD